MKLQRTGGKVDAAIMKTDTGGYALIVADDKGCFWSLGEADNRAAAEILQKHFHARVEEITQST